MSALADATCEACRPDSPRVNPEERAELLRQVPKWQILEREDADRLQREFRFPDFVQALEFTNRVGDIAEAEGHHPALLTEWGRVTVNWWTHAIRGLHHNDFVMAAKTDRIYDELAVQARAD
ncbi:MAG: 4a-hydroxytetrahydrobiopterin dehydratase [Longimicrobiales bacterium]